MRLLPPIAACDRRSALSFAGGVLYERLGYRAPFVFSLVVIAVDLILRALLIEKPVALRWIRAGHEIPNFEAPGYVTGASPCAAMPPEPDVSTTDSLGASTSTIDKEEPAEEAAPPDKKGHHPRLPPHLLGLLHMLKSPRALTGFSVTMLNGIVIGGLMDSGLTLWVKQEYGLNSSGAGLVFLGVVIPTFFVRPSLPHALLHRKKTLTSLTVSRAGVPACRLGQSRSRSRTALVLCRSPACERRSPISTGPSGPWPLALPCRSRHTLSSSSAALSPCSSSSSPSSVSLASRT